MTEQTEHVIKTWLNHLFISCHQKKRKKNMVERKDAMPNAFEVSLNTKALITLTQSAVVDLLPFDCYPEHESISCTVCCVYCETFLFSFGSDMAITAYSFIKRYFLLLIITTSWTVLMFA